MMYPLRMGLSHLMDLYLRYMALTDRPCDRLLSAKLVSTLADRGCRVVSATDPYGRVLDFPDRSRYFFYQVAPQLYSRG
jgi:hypothetical protein